MSNVTIDAPINIKDFFNHFNSTLDSSKDVRLEMDRDVDGVLHKFLHVSDVVDEVSSVL